MEIKAKQEEAFYEISAVAHLTGISSHVLRVWERRYNVVEPLRSESKRRQYSKEDIGRLRLLKTLVDSGHAIGSIAKLSTPQLNERVASLRDAQGLDAKLDETETSNLRIGLVGSTIREPVRSAADLSELHRVVGEFESLEEMKKSLQFGSVDVLFFEVDTLFLEEIEKLELETKEIGAKRMVLAYRFAQGEVHRMIEGTNITAIRAPVDISEVRLAMGILSRPIMEAARTHSTFVDDSGAAIPGRQFSDERLVRISKVSSPIDCECPKHLSNLLRSLHAFEQYSERCEHRNEQDAELHGFLHRTTAMCRHEMEKALERVLKEEGISI
ncbi:MAG: MerR family transcriptional regulator [Verrucomicrobiota bacterium]